MGGFTSSGTQGLLQVLRGHFWPLSRGPSETGDKAQALTCTASTQSIEIFFWPLNSVSLAFLTVSPVKSENTRTDLPDLGSANTRLHSIFQIPQWEALKGAYVSDLPLFPHQSHISSFCLFLTAGILKNTWKPLCPGSSLYWCLYGNNFVCTLDWYFGWV